MGGVQGLVSRLIGHERGCVSTLHRKSDEAGPLAASFRAVAVMETGRIVLKLPLTPLVLDGASY